MDLENKNIVVVGCKRTGTAVARFLARRDARVTITDMAGEAELGQSIEKMQPWISSGAVKLELGGHIIETFEKADLVVVSPGVPHTIAPIAQARAKNVPVIGEIELAFRFIEAPIVAISGTNGKTTTTELLGQMLNCSKIKNFVGGNIGNPLIEYADQEEKVQVVVLEISSFQLDTTMDFKPSVAVLLNITDDHLDRYDGLNAYAVSKSRLFMKQGPGDTAILNKKDLAAYPFLADIKSRKCIFNMDRNAGDVSPGEGAVIGEKEIAICFKGQTRVLDLKGIHLAGRHNMENIAAASLGALAVGATLEGIQEAIGKFKGLPHRLSYVNTLHGVAYYNDSKATNVDAVKRAIETFSTPVVLIMGGRDKGGEFHLLKKVLADRVKTLVVMGEAADTITETFKECVPVVRAASMADAVKKAGRCAAEGDAVLLSPGCASFDMYESYAHRGKAFETAVHHLAEQRTT